MRHVFGFILGVVLVPALAYAVGMGSVQAGRGFDWTTRTISNRGELFGGFGFLAAVGLIIGVVAVVRWISPLAALVPALAYLGWTAYFLVSPGGALDLPGKVPPAGDVDQGLQSVLAMGVLGLLGLALLVPSFRGWRSDYFDEGEPFAEEYF